MSPSDFLHLLWGQKLPALYILIWTRQGKESRWFRDLGKAATFIEGAHGRDVYVGVGLSRSDNGPHRRCPSDGVAGLAGFWADFDLRSEAHTKTLPSSIEEALTIIPSDLPPTITIATGNGVHCWWLFDAPWIFESAEERNDAATLSTRFQTLLQYNSHQRGWAFDKLADLARVLRIPGTVNAKDPENPKKVEAFSVEGRRYIHEEIRAYLDRQEIPDAAGEERAVKELAQRYVNSPLIINLQASISDDLLSSWLSNDSRFRQTWNRERKDMRDQSGSGYDMALVSFGVKVGLSDQQIVDLIIHHRRLHGDRQRRTADYFQRTIAKARRAEPALIVRVLAGDSNVQESAGDDSVDNGVDETIRKAQLCGQLSSLLGVRILRLQKIPAHEPIYLMELETGRIEFDIARLTTQRSVKLALAGRTGKIIPTFKSQHWREITQRMLDACTVVDGTDDLQFEGAARIHLDRYLSDNPALPSVDGVARRDIFKPVIFKEQVTVHTTDLQFYLSQTARLNASVPRLAAMLTALGASEVRIREGAYRDQSRWGLPTDQFPPRDYRDGDMQGRSDVA